MEDPAPYALLNSLTDNPTVGDERNFFRVRLDEKGTTYSDSIDVKPGDVVLVSLWLRNAAADNLAGPAATIHGLQCQLYVPVAAKDLPLGATLQAKNATTVWDGAMIHSTTPISVQIVNGSAEFSTNQADYKLPDSLGKGEWTTLGETGPDGEFPVGLDNDGRGQGTAWLLYKLIVVAAN